MSPKRTPIKAFGSYGSTVNVYGMELSGEPVARVEWRQFGERKTETFRGPKRDRENAAKAYAEGVAERLRQGEQVKTVRYTIAELWKAYLTAKGVNWRPKTKLLALQRWKVFTTTVNPLTFADLLTQETLDTWREALLTVPTKKTGAVMARNQVAHHIQLVKSVYRFARKRKLIRENPIADYAVREGRDYQPLEVPEFTPAQWGKVLAQVPFRHVRYWRVWLALALDGLLAPRSNALLNLEWSDIDMATRTVTWRGVLDKVGKTRVQPLPRDAVFALRVAKVWRARIGYTGPYLFPPVQERNKDGHWGYASLNRQLDLACKRAKVPRQKYQSMHAFRRMVAGNVLDVTGDITKVGDYLGDSDVRVLRRSYLRNRVGHLTKVAEAMTLPPSPESGADNIGNETATGAVKGRPLQTSTRRNS